MKSSAKGKGKERALIDDDSDVDFATQGFEARESDSEQLWDVIAIRGERAGMYLIQWAGADENGKPWDDSWVPREDVTDDLVEAWKMRKVAEKKEKARKKAERRERKRQGSSTTASRSRTNSKTSTTASSGTVRRSKRMSSVTTVGRADTASVSTVRSSPVKKRKKPTVSETGDELSDVERSSPRKKRKIGPDGESRRSSPRKKSKSRPPDSGREEEDESEDERVEPVKPTKSKPQNSRKEGEGGSEDDRSAPIKHSKSGHRHVEVIPNPKPNAKLSPAIVHEEGEGGEGEEEVNIAEWSKTTKDRSDKSKPVPDAKVKKTVKSKPATGPLAPVAPSNGLSETGRILDKRPTPPRRTLTKTNSGRTESRTSAASSSHNEPKKATKHRSTPGVRVGAEDRKEDVSNLNRSEGAKSSEIPDVPTMSVSDTTEEKANGHRGRSHSRSNESDQVVATSPSKLRQGLTARMKGKEKPKSDSSKLGSNIRSRLSSRASSVESEDENTGVDIGDNDQSEAQRRRSPSIPVPTHPAPTSIPIFIPDEPGATGIFASNVDESSEPVFDYTAFDDPLPFSQDDEPLLGETEAQVSNMHAEPNKNTSVTVSESIGSVQEMGVGVHSEERHPDDSQDLKGTVIPASQSQSQSYSHSGSQDGAQDSAQLASMLAEHGSSASHIDAVANADISMAPATLVSSLVFEMPPETTSPSITDPEPSATTSTNAKAHKKIPIVTPSKFRPYLPQPQRPLSTLPPPHIQGVQSLATHARDDVPTSSFESPVKDFDAEGRAIGRKRGRRGADPSSNAEKNELSADDDIEDDMPRSLELRHRGLELAEIQRRRMREEVREPVARIQLDVLLEEVARDPNSRLKSREWDISNPSVSDLEPTHLLPGHPGETNSNVEEEDDEARVRRFEEDYLDFDGNAGASTPASSGARSALDETPGSTLDEQRDGQQSVAPEDDTHEEMDVESSLQDAIDADDPFISRGGAKDRAVTPTTTTSQQEDMDLPYTPARPRFKILGSPSKLETSVVQTPSRQLNEAMGLLHAKSEEIEFLKRQLAESERKRLSQDDVLAELQAETSVLKKMQEKQLDASAELEEGEIEQYKEKYERLSKDRDALDAEIKLLKMSRDDSVKQAEIFRELYGKASSFADEMKQENVELLARAKLAEGQVNVGLELIRKQNAAQEQKLRAELEQQQILVHVLSTKDRRTDDEVRRCAALEPELQGKINILHEEIRDLEAGQSNVVRHRDELLVEKQELSGQLEDMRAKYNTKVDDMCWLQIQIARFMAREKAFKKVFLTSSDSTHDNEFDRGEERVYICKWMMNHDGKSRCNSLFTNVQDLKDHLFVDHQM